MKKKKQLTKEEKMKIASKKWVILCLEMLGYSHLIPKEKNTTSAIEELNEINRIKKYLDTNEQKQ